MLFKAAVSSTCVVAIFEIERVCVFACHLIRNCCIGVPGTTSTRAFLIEHTELN